MLGFFAVFALFFTGFKVRKPFYHGGPDENDHARPTTLELSGLLLVTR